MEENGSSFLLRLWHPKMLIYLGQSLSHVALLMKEDKKAN